MVGGPRGSTCLEYTELHTSMSDYLLDLSRRFQVPTLARLKGRGLVDVCSLGAEYKRERTKKISPFLRKRPRGKDLSSLSLF